MRILLIRAEVVALLAGSSALPRWRGRGSVESAQVSWASGTRRGRVRCSYEEIAS
jgi:hypothetical protein